MTPHPDAETEPLYAVDESGKLRTPDPDAVSEPLFAVDESGKLWRAGPTQAFCSCGWEGSLRRDSHEACDDIDTHRAETGGGAGHDVRWRFADLPDSS